jgi:hypothetical protein
MYQNNFAELSISDKNINICGICEEKQLSYRKILKLLNVIDSGNKYNCVVCNKNLLITDIFDDDYIINFNNKYYIIYGIDEISNYNIMTYLSSLYNILTNFDKNTSKLNYFITITDGVNKDNKYLSRKSEVRNFEVEFNNYDFNTPSFINVKNKIDTYIKNGVYNFESKKNVRSNIYMLIPVENFKLKVPSNFYYNNTTNNNQSCINRILSYLSSFIYSSSINEENITEILLIKNYILKLLKNEKTKINEETIYEEPKLQYTVNKLNIDDLLIKKDILIKSFKEHIN